MVEQSTWKLVKLLGNGVLKDRGYYQFEIDLP